MTGITIALMMLIMAAPALAQDDRYTNDSALLFIPFSECEWEQYQKAGYDSSAVNFEVCEDDAATLVGTNGPDKLYGGNADDVLIGRKGKDLLWGGEGNDVLRGGKGADVLIGNLGLDELIGGNGDDTLTGAHSRYESDLDPDRFVFASKDRGDKIITDFDPCFSGRDYIVLSGGGFRSVSKIVASERAGPDGYYVYRLAKGLTVETDMRLRASDFVIE